MKTANPLVVLRYYIHELGSDAMAYALSKARRKIEKTEWYKAFMKRSDAQLISWGFKNASIGIEADMDKEQLPTIFCSGLDMKRLVNILPAKLKQESKDGLALLCEQLSNGHFGMSIGSTSIPVIYERVSGCAYREKTTGSKDFNAFRKWLLMFVKGHREQLWREQIDEYNSLMTDEVLYRTIKSKGTLYLENGRLASKLDKLLAKVEVKNDQDNES